MVLPLVGRFLIQQQVRRKALQEIAKFGKDIGKFKKDFAKSGGVQISVAHNFPEVQRKVEQLREDIQKRALVSAINKTMDRGKTEMKRSIIKEFAVSSSYVQDQLYVRGARASSSSANLAAELLAKSNRRRSRNVIAFAKTLTLSQANRARRKSKRNPELRFVFKRGSDIKNIEGSFIGNKGRTVFIRTGGTMASRSRYAGSKHAEAIEAVQVIDVSQMFNTRRINMPVRMFIQNKFPEIFAREADFFIKKFNQK